jgi:hypothetical protein
MWACREICSNARQHWPTFVSTMSLNHVPDAVKIAVRTELAAVMIFALESWSFGFLAGAPGLPPIDWSAFGEDAEAIRTQAAELMGEWKAAAAKK